MIVALVGEESLLVRRALDKLLEERLPRASRDFNLDIFEGAQVKAEEVMERAMTLPVLAARRVLLVRNADEIKKGEGEGLEPFLKRVPETTDLILTAEKIDRRLRFWQELLKCAELREFRPLYEREVPAWILQEAAHAGYRIDLQAARWIVSTLGTDLSLLHSTLEKLYLLKGTERSIELEDLEGSVTHFSWRSVFDLAEAVGRRDLPRALKLFRKMVQAGESPVALLGQLAWHFRTLSKVKEGQVAGVSPFFLKHYQEQAGQFSGPGLHEKREKLFLTDWALKSSPLPAPILFERLLIDLCGRAEMGHHR